MADIAALERQLAELQARDAELETRFNQLQPQVEAARARLREAEQRLADLDRQFPRSVSLSDITRAREAAEANPSDAAAQQRLQDLRSQFAEQRQQRTEFLADAQAQLNTAQQEFRAAVAPQSEITFESEQLANEISAVQQQITSSRQQGPATQSAGETVTDAADARGETGSVQNPPQTPTTVQDDAPDGSNSNASGFQEQEDVGTDGRLRTTQETQATPPNNTGTLAAAASDTGEVPGVTVSDRNQTDPGYVPNAAGAAAAPDDASRTDTAGQQNNSVINLVNRTATTITPRSNILSNFSSYTYSVSLYLMTPEDYQRLMTQKKKFIPGYLLLMQSGGAPVQSGVVPATPESQENIAQGGVSLSQGRNQFFPLDFYIDDVEIKTVMPGKGTGAAHNVTQLKFKIIEPLGITLLDNLYAAVQQYINVGGGASESTANKNYAAQNYLMVIRFYGYDSEGNLLTAQQLPASAANTDKSDANAIIEKFIPFQFTNIKFRIANKLTEYECEAVAPQNVVATGQGRGVIPYNIQLTATTLQSLFNGNETYSRAQDDNNATRDTRTDQPPTAPDNAAAAPKPTLVTGLAQALNRYQEEFVKRGEQEIADRYKIVISHPELANASITQPLGTNRNSKPMTSAASAAQVKDGDKQSVQNTAKTQSATAGMPITQFIDLAVRTSDYIYKQQTKLKTRDKNGKAIDVPQNTAAKAFAWYRIGVQAKPIGYDRLRREEAYEITYEIAPYGVNNVKSEYFPQGRFRGVQKRYAYWFTGENTEILDFEQDFNYLYYIVINSRQTISPEYGLTNVREIEKRLNATNSAQPNQGGDRDNQNEPGANAADYLYSPADQSQVKLKILGDPAWIAQGEVWSGIRSTAAPDSSGVDVFFDAFLADGTINFDAREALFEVAFNKPRDYNINTGIIEGL